MQCPPGSFNMVAGPTPSNQQNIMPRPPTQPPPSASPTAGGGRMQHLAAAPPGSMPPPPPSSAGSARPQATLRPRFDVWSLVSGMLKTDNQGNPLHTPQQVAEVLHQFIFESLHRMPFDDGKQPSTFLQLFSA
ncbi:hypothetical protein PG994_014958 [Apiospora phragmitis]|uniref:Uncharacterized protein n=1 Tax=Apiospora phragmitis TaxID=2905665 RepID=A0ABR1SV31_9PEZI